MISDYDMMDAIDIAKAKNAVLVFEDDEQELRVSYSGEELDGLHVDDHEVLRNGNNEFEYDLDWIDRVYVVDNRFTVDEKELFFKGTPLVN